MQQIRDATSNEDRKLLVRLWGQLVAGLSFKATSTKKPKDMNKFPQEDVLKAMTRVAGGIKNIYLGRAGGQRRKLRN